MANPAFRLLHITDTHLFEDAEGRLRGVDTQRTLARVLARAQADPRPVGAVLATGDLSQDEKPAAYQRFRTLLSPLGVPVWCLPGNHDAPPAMTAILETPPFRLGGTVAAGNWRVILLNSCIAGDHGGRIAPGQLEWLEATLRDQRDAHVLIAVHHHVLPLGSRWLDELGLYNSDDLLAIVDRAPRVRCVVAGHVHQASDISRNGVRYLTTPSTCFQFLPAVDNFAVDVRPPGFRWLDLMPDGDIATEVVWVDPPP